MAAIEATGPDLPRRQTRGAGGRDADPDERDRMNAIRELREFGKGRHLDGVTARELIDEGRRH